MKQDNKYENINLNNLQYRLKKLANLLVNSQTPGHLK